MYLCMDACDANILNVFSKILSVSERSGWDVALHGVEYNTWVRQARLPLRLSGCGLRDSARVSPAAYWASWADCLQDIVERYPTSGNMILTTLANLQSRRDDEVHIGVECLVAAELAGKHCSSVGFTNRPLWVDLAAGLRPPELQQEGSELGEWRHGWQYHASDACETAELHDLKQTLALSNTRRNAACSGKARLESCMGPFSTTWLTACPVTEACKLKNEEIQCALRRRLGMAVWFEGSDQHGNGALNNNLGGRMNARHTVMLSAWKQVLAEAGGSIPDRNVERLLSNTHIPVPSGDMRRLDLIVPGLNVYNGLPLFCDITVINPLSRTGGPRPGTSNAGGRLLDTAEADNEATHHEVVASGLGHLLCLGCEVFVRWGRQCTDLVPKLAREKSRGMHPRIRRGMALAWQQRWFGLLGISLQRAVAHCILHHSTGADLVTSLLEPFPHAADVASAGC